MANKEKASQEFVPIKEVRDGVLVLDDGSLRGILLTSSVNFALKSLDAQQAIIYQFQNFLNSLDFSVQIAIQSKRLDIRPYLALMEERYRAQLTDLMKIQVREYIEFVRTFTENSNIMSKSFFIVVPYSPAIMQGKSFIPSGLFGRKQTAKEKTQDERKLFEEQRLQLLQRMSIVEQGLLRMGLRSIQLGTEEIIELFYKIFNPGETDKPIQPEQQ